MRGIWRKFLVRGSNLFELPIFKHDCMWCGCSFGVRDIALFFHTGAHECFLAFNCGCPHYYLSKESLASTKRGNAYVFGEIILITEKIASEVGDFCWVTLHVNTLSFVRKKTNFNYKLVRLIMRLPLPFWALAERALDCCKWAMSMPSSGLRLCMCN